MQYPNPLPAAAGILDYGFDGDSAQAQRWQVLEGQHIPAFPNVYGVQRGYLAENGQYAPWTGPEPYSQAGVHVQAIETFCPDFDVETDAAMAFASNFDDFYSLYQAAQAQPVPAPPVRSESALNRFLRLLRG